MTWTLTLCIGIFLGVCGSRQVYDYSSQEDCYRAQKEAQARPNIAFAVCAPKKVEAK